MVLTDKKALELAHKSRELWTAIEEYPDYDVDGRSDLQLVADEASYVMVRFDDPDYMLGEDLQNARELIRESRYYEVNSADLYCAKELVNERKAVKAVCKSLERMGYIGREY